MRKIFLSLMMLCIVLPAWARYPSDVEVLSKEKIRDLSDEKVVDVYMNTLVEIEAQKTFHTTSGFSPKDYQEYKDLLRFRLDLLSEIHRRKIEVPQFDRFAN